MPTMNYTLPLYQSNQNKINNPVKESPLVQLQVPHFGSIDNTNGDQVLFGKWTASRREPELLKRLPSLEKSKLPGQAPSLKKTKLSGQASNPQKSQLRRVLTGRITKNSGSIAPKEERIRLRSSKSNANQRQVGFSTAGKYIVLQNIKDEARAQRRVQGLNKKRVEHGLEPLEKPKDITWRKAWENVEAWRALKIGIERGVAELETTRVHFPSKEYKENTPQFHSMLLKLNRKPFETDFHKRSLIENVSLELYPPTDKLRDIKRLGKDEPRGGQAHGDVPRWLREKLVKENPSNPYYAGPATRGLWDTLSPEEKKLASQFRKTPEQKLQDERTRVQSYVVKYDKKIEELKDRIRTHGRKYNAAELKETEKTANKFKQQVQQLDFKLKQAQAEERASISAHTLSSRASSLSLEPPGLSRGSTPSSSRESTPEPGAIMPTYLLPMEIDHLPQKPSVNYPIRSQQFTPSPGSRPTVQGFDGEKGNREPEVRVKSEPNEEEFDFSNISSRPTLGTSARVDTPTHKAATVNYRIEKPDFVEIESRPVLPSIEEVRAEERPIKQEYPPLASNPGGMRRHTSKGFEVAKTPFVRRHTSKGFEVAKTPFVRRHTSKGFEVARAPFVRRHTSKQFEVPEGQPVSSGRSDIDGEIVDRTPPPPAKQKRVQSPVALRTGLSNQYPVPPSHFPAVFSPQGSILGPVSGRAESELAGHLRTNDIAPGPHQPVFSPLPPNWRDRDTADLLKEAMSRSLNLPKKQVFQQSNVFASTPDLKSQPVPFHFSPNYNYWNASSWNAPFIPVQ